MSLTLTPENKNTLTIANEMKNLSYLLLENGSRILQETLDRIFLDPLTGLSFNGEAKNTLTLTSENKN